MESRNMTTFSDSEQHLPQLFLLLENSSKGNNLGSILRCASAFGITTVVAIGFSKCSVQGSHGASKNINIVAFPTGVQAEKYLREERLCTTIIGLMGPLPNGYDSDNCPVYNDHTTNCVKFTLDGALRNRCSISLDVMAFAKSNICVGLSKERQGLPWSISRCCDLLVHIPHLPFCGDTPLLDTPSCLSILLSSLCESIGFNERAFHEHKFDVTRPTQHLIDLGQPDSNTTGQRDTNNTREDIEQDGALQYGITCDSTGDY